MCDPDRDIRVVLSSAIKVIPSISTSLNVSCTPPGSKSISNRALVLAALGKGTCRIRNLLHSDDTEVMLNALVKLNGASFAWEEDGKVLAVTGNGGKLTTADEPLYLGNAGTASRFLTTVATLVGGRSHTVLTGNKRMKLRPIGPLVDTLRENGATISYVEKTGSLPIEVKANQGMAGGDITLAANVSSQYVSSILLSSPYAKQPTNLRLVGGKVISQPYIDMTCSMMATFGIKVKKSTTEDHTYHIPSMVYSNPPNYDVESDASSATYPLAFAAITGTTCTIPNIGSSSLQGDAQFAPVVLKAMGCEVNQTSTATTVTGPRKGGLKPIPEGVDMEPMTDAFLTASILAAVAQGEGSSTTRITGIANQRVKECNRIEAMRLQLKGFGVTCRELDDGLEIDGISINSLQQPEDGVKCYDDHRVAMSFSVLAAASPRGALIRERECVGKTWPGWWDTLKQTFETTLEGVDLNEPAAFNPQWQNFNRSVIIIGMRGAGKTTIGQWVSRIMGWPFVDLDTKLESDAGRQTEFRSSWTHDVNSV